MKKIIFTVFIVFLLSDFLSARTGAVVSFVYDGDTIAVNIKGKKKPVRLIGIDCPESRGNAKARRDAKRKGEDMKKIIAMGKRATKFVKGLVKKGDSVGLDFDAQESDRYGRLLAYVYLKDGRMLNDVIIRSGYASPMTIPPNVKYKSKFAGSYRYARNNNLGLWAK